MSDKEPPKLTDTRFFAMLLEHAIQVNNEILNATEQVDDLDGITATVPAEFMLDITDMLIQLAVIYEDFNAAEVDELLDMQRKYQTKFGNRTIH